MACAGERRKTKKIGNSVSISRVLFLPNPYGQGSLLSFIYSVSHPTALAFYPPPSHRSDGTPSNDGIHELAAPRWHSPMITHRLVVSYTTFSPLPYYNSMAVVFFYRHLPSPTASIFGSGVPYAARTFLSCAYAQQRQNRDTVSNEMQRYCKFLSNGNDWGFFFHFIEIETKVKIVA